MNAYKCTLCPRRCGADRTRTTGFCGGANHVRAARAALHTWEEPCISGTCGSGTVFFSGCALQCCFCQNYEISAGNFGKELTVQQLADVFLSLQKQGAHNINLVNPTHYAPWVAQAVRLARPRLQIPVVCNTGGYESMFTCPILSMSTRAAARVIQGRPIILKQYRPLCRRCSAKWGLSKWTQMGCCKRVC